MGKTVPSEVMGSIRSMVEGIDVSPIGQTVLLDIHTCGLRLSEVMAFVALAQQRFPYHEIFMDGDCYAIVARAKGCTA